MIKKSLIIDSRLVALNQEDCFDNNWIWPIRHSQYHNPIAEFIKWSDNLHKELTDNPNLLNAYFLIKSDLLKDLICFTSAWIDIAEAKKQDIELIYGPDQYILESLITNSFSGLPPTERLRNVKTNGLTNRVKSKLARLKRYKANNKALNNSLTRYYATSLNELGKQISPDGTSALRFTSYDLNHMRSQAGVYPTRLDELAHQISDALIKIISCHNSAPSKAFRKYTHSLAFHYLTNGWSDAATSTIVKKIKPPSTLITGTGSGYSARFLSYQFLISGQDVIRTTHGGESPFFGDMLHPTIDFPFASKYIAYGEVAAQKTRETIHKRSECVYPYYTHSVEAAGSNFHSRIHNRATTVYAKAIKSITVVAGSFNAEYRPTPQAILHDVVYMEWHRRLLKMTRKLGFSVTSKRHPKGIMSGTPLFSAVADQELLNTTMAETEENTDVYIFDFQSSAFMEALCTLKPVVLIYVPIRPMHIKARSQIMKSVSIVNAEFDEQNRVVINVEELHSAIMKPIDIDARRQLIEDYLLRPSATFSQNYL